MSELAALIRAGLAGLADPGRAASQQAYMKSAMPFYGVGVPRVRQLTGAALATRPPADRESWEAVVRELWDEATHREERYAALAVLRHRSSRLWLTPEALPLVRHLVVTGAWWDLVDETAHVLEAILAADPAGTVPVIDQWSDAGDLWLRRVAILSQLQRGPHTDTGLLERCIRRNVLGSDFGEEFFIRKAIGWALRQYARVSPEWVRAFLDAHNEELSPLSRREAAKYLRGDAPVGGRPATGRGAAPRPG